MTPHLPKTERSQERERCNHRSRDGVLWTHTKEYQRSLGTRRDKEQLFPKSSGGGVQACGHPDFRLLSSEMDANKSLLLQANRSMKVCYSGRGNKYTHKNKGMKYGIESQSPSSGEQAGTRFGGLADLVK